MVPWMLWHRSRNKMLPHSPTSLFFPLSTSVRSPRLLLRCSAAPLARPMVAACAWLLGEYSGDLEKPSEARGRARRAEPSSPVERTKVTRQ